MATGDYPYGETYGTQADGGASQQPNWWEGPKPANWPASIPWPPPLGPGDTYGQNFGQINKAGFVPGQANTTLAPGTNAVPGVDLPLANPVTQQTTTGGGVDTGGGGGGTAGTYGQGGGSSFAFPEFTPPVYNAGPQFQPGQFGAPPAFSYKDFNYDPFTAPTLEQAQAQPGYQFALDQGRKALENSAAARGVLRTGGTLKDLFSWGDKFAEQNYGNVFNQDLQGYTTNRGNAFENYSANRANAADTYRTNYGISKDVFDTNYGSSKDAWQLNDQQNKDVFDRLYQGDVASFNPKFQAASLKFADLYNRDRDKLNAALSLAGLGA